MRLIIEPDYARMSKWAANYVAQKLIAAKPTAEKPFVLGLPTGSSPLGMYRELIDLNKRGDTIASVCKVLALHYTFRRFPPPTFYIVRHHFPEHEWQIDNIDAINTLHLPLHRCPCALAMTSTYDCGNACRRR
jgi:hypothetical protein